MASIGSITNGNRIGCTSTITNDYNKPSKWKVSTLNSTIHRSRPSVLRFLVVVLFLLGTAVCGVDAAIGSWNKQKEKEQPTVETDTTGEKNDSGNNNNNNNNSSSNNSDVNKTYLDLFGESAKDFLTRRAPERIAHAFPATDSECRWDWRYLRCEPYCGCSLRPKLPGDFHLGRACRKREAAIGEVDGNDKDADAEQLYTGSEKYRTYCSSGTTNNSTHQQHHRTPPPPSIPSPFPFLARTSKATWRIVRAKADPVVAKAVDELETIQSKVQAVICGDLKTRCYDGYAYNYDGNSKSGDNRHSYISAHAPPISNSIEVAWQERLFCPDIVRDCKRTSKSKTHNTPEERVGSNHND